MICHVDIFFHRICRLCKSIKILRHRRRRPLAVSSPPAARYFRTPPTAIISMMTCEFLHIDAEGGFDSQRCTIGSAWAHGRRVKRGYYHRTHAQPSVTGSGFSRKRAPPPISSCRRQSRILRMRTGRHHRRDSFPGFLPLISCISPRSY